jgi:hypothetical protein
MVFEEKLPEFTRRYASCPGVVNQINHIGGYLLQYVFHSYTLTSFGESRISLMLVKRIQADNDRAQMAFGFSIWG